MEHESNPKDALYDFIYLDAPRAKRFCVQLYQDGNLQTLTKHQTLARFDGVTADVNFHLVGGKKEGSERTEDVITHHYDAADLLPLLLLDGLSSSSSIHDSISATPLGRIFLCSGSIEILDINTLDGLWEPAFDMFKQQSHEEMKGQPGAKGGRKQAQTQLDRYGKAVLGIIKGLPNSIHMRFRSGDTKAWSTLSPEHMMINPADIILKHGEMIPGEWQVLGIMDAEVGHQAESSDSDGQSMVSGIKEMIGIVLREFGRPADSYGFTPIAVFRDTSKR